MTWIQLRQRIVEPTVPETQRTPDPSFDAPSDVRREPTDTAAVTPPRASLPPRQIDWGANATYHARAAVEAGSAERYRNLGPRPPGPPPLPQAPSVFKQPGKAFGDLDKDINEHPIVRLSENCYFELDKLVLTARDIVIADANLPPMAKCMFPVGKPEPRGDLFEHLKRDQPLPAPKEGSVGELPAPDQK